MSTTANVLTTTCLVGTLPSAGTVALLHATAYGGGYTVIGARLGADGLATAVGAQLVTMGTTMNGDQAAVATIGTLVGGGTACVFAMGSVAAFQLTSPYVQSGKWLGLKLAADSGGTSQVTCYLNYCTGIG
jgi:hypothetical protein